MAWHRLEILPAEPQRLVQIGKADGSDDGRGRGILRWLSQRRDIAGIGVPWSLSPLPQRPISRRSRAQAAVCRNDHDQARREDRKPKLAMSRTEPSAYSQSPVVAHASVRCLGAVAAQTSQCVPLHAVFPCRRHFASVADSPVAALASAAEVAKLCRAAGARTVPFSLFDHRKSLGANDEHFRKNHERDLWHQGRRCSGKRRLLLQARLSGRPHRPADRLPHRLHRRNPSMSRRSWTRRSPPRAKSWNGAPRSSI